MGFDQADLLRQSAYSPGDVVPLVTLNDHSGGGTDTTNTSFTGANIRGAHILRLDRIAPSGAQLVASMAADLRPGTDETYDVRYRDLTNNDTIAEITDVTTNQFVQSDWTAYTPSDPDNAGFITVQHRTDPGTNPSNISDNALLIGVQL